MMYEQKCTVCGTVLTVIRPMARRNDPYECECGGETERIPSVPYVTPESMYVEGSVTTRGKRAILNDVDDPWSGTPLEGQSEEFCAKRDEALGRRASNWGDRRGTIVFDCQGPQTLTYRQSNSRTGKSSPVFDSCPSTS